MPRGKPDNHTLAKRFAEILLATGPDDVTAAQNLIAELRGQTPVSEPDWVTKARSIYQRIESSPYQGLALKLAAEALNGSPVDARQEEPE